MPDASLAASPRLLVGVDFSHSAGAAWTRAGQLAAALGIGIRPVHVRSPSADADWRAAEATVAWLRQRGLCAADVDGREGTPWIELARAAEEPGVTLLVIGSHGQSGYQPVRLGTTAGRLAMVSPVPVLMVAPDRRGFRNTERLAAIGAP